MEHINQTQIRQTATIQSHSPTIKSIDAGEAQNFSDSEFPWADEINLSNDNIIKEGFSYQSSKKSVFKIFLTDSNFWIAIFICILCIFMSIVSFLYGLGQITQLELTNYWCDKKNLQTIYQHSETYGLNGGTDDGCWKSKQFSVKYTL